MELRGGRGKDGLGLKERDVIGCDVMGCDVM